MTVSILGCGWFGKALAVKLKQQGEQIKGSITHINKQIELGAFGIVPYVINFPDTDNKNNPNFFYADVLIISIPPKFRKGEADLFIAKIEAIISAIIHAGIKKVIYISSTGVYSDGQGVVDEHTLPVPDDKHGVLLLQAERLFQISSQFNTSVIRFGGLVGIGRHPGKFFSGKDNLPDGLSPVNLLHLDDAVAITMAVLKNEVWGQVFNACFPDHPTRASFYKWAAANAGLQSPKFINEKGITKTVESINLKQLLGYQFLHDNWTDYTFS